MMESKHDNVDKKNGKQDEFNLESLDEFIDRLQCAKDKLIQYNMMNSTSKKILVIASSQTLNLLGATGYHETGEAVNALTM